MIAQTPPPPYYAVIFTSTRTNIDAGYADMAAKMLALANQQPGYLGHESARNEIGITISYWATLEAIQQWKQQTDHLVAQQLGKEQWYAAFTTRICLVEKAYSWQQ